MNVFQEHGSRQIWIHFVRLDFHLPLTIYEQTPWQRPVGTSDLLLRWSVSRVTSPAKSSGLVPIRRLLFAKQNHISTPFVLL